MTSSRIGLARAVVATAVAVACSRPDPPGEVNVTAPSIATANLVGGPPSSTTAFDLAAAPFGVSVAWVESQRGEASLVTLDLNDRGHAERDAWQLLSLGPDEITVSDLSFGWQGMNRLVTWLERRGGQARARALSKTETESALPVDLGTAFPASLDARGNVALAVTAERATVFMRGVEEPCDHVDPCYGFRFHRFGTEPSARVSLSVPVPCGAHAAQLVLTHPRWYYAVCTTQNGKPVLTLFTIQPEPEYAAARQILEDCLPLGALLLSDRPALIAQCGSQRNIVWLGKGDDAPIVERLDPTLPSCEGTPQLQAGSVNVRLDSPQSGLEPLLSEVIAPAGALAAWTGKVLVVARHTPAGVALTRHGCRAGAFVGLDDAHG